MITKELTATVAAVIPTRARPELLSRAIESVLNQTRPVDQVIIVDDNDSPDLQLKTRAVVSSFLDSRLIYIPNERTKGGAGARNTGVLVSRCTHIAFLDDDDTWASEKIERQMEIFRTTPHAVVFCGYIDDDRVFMRRTAVLPDHEVTTLQDLLRGECPTSTSLAVVSKQVLQIAGLFDESLGSLQDYDLWIRCATVCPLISLRTPLATFVQHQGQRVSTDVTRRMEALDIVTHKLLLTKQLDAKGAASLRRLILGSLYLGTTKRLSPDHPLDALVSAVKALRYQPLNCKAWKWLVASLFVKPILTLRRARET